MGTTNATENWHRQLKRNGAKGQMKGVYSLKDTVLQVIESLRDYEKLAEQNAIHFRSFSSPLGQLLPNSGLDKLPGPVQSMVLNQYK
jgi:hypothetical protein